LVSYGGFRSLAKSFVTKFSFLGHSNVAIKL
jgi:hypothetical protein